MFAKTNSHHQKKSFISNGKESSDGIYHWSPSMWNFHHPWCSANTRDFKNRVATKKWNLVASPWNTEVEEKFPSKMSLCRVGCCKSTLLRGLAVWSVASWAVDNLKIIWILADMSWFSPFLLFSLPSLLIRANLPNI